MLLAICIVSVVIWLVCAPLSALIGRHHAWRAAPVDRHKAAVLRSIRELRFGVYLLAWLGGVLALVSAGALTWGYEEQGLVIILVAAIVGHFAVRYEGMQQLVLSGITWIIRTCGSKLMAVRAIMRVCHAVGRNFFSEAPLFMSAEELHGLVRHQQQAHRAMDPWQYQRLEVLLKVADTSVEDKIVPLKKAPMVKAGDTVGPLLLAELHDAPYGAFAVYDMRRSNIVGVLDQGVALSHAKRSAKVSSMMEERLVYLPARATYQQALRTFIETSSVLSVIIDENQRPTGVLYVQDILRDLFGAEDETT